MEWEHYARLEPFNELRADYRAASIVSILYNINRGKNDSPLSISDAAIKFGEQDEAPKPQHQTRADHISLIKTLAMAYSVPGKDD